jgi:hypothetical protein
MLPGANTNPMDDKSFVSEARQSLAILRWAPLLGITGLPFTFWNGPIGWQHLLDAWIMGTLLVGALLMRWRTRRDTLSAVAFLGILWLGRYLGPDAKAPTSIILQWACFIVIFAGIPMVFFPKYILRFARLDENTNTNGNRAKNPESNI